MAVGALLGRDPLGAPDRRIAAVRGHQEAGAEAQGLTATRDLQVHPVRPDPQAHQARRAQQVHPRRRGQGRTDGRPHGTGARHIAQGLHPQFGVIEPGDPAAAALADVHLEDRLRLGGDRAPETDRPQDAAAAERQGNHPLVIARLDRGIRRHGLDHGHPQPGPGQGTGQGAADQTAADDDQVVMGVVSSGWSGECLDFDS